MPYSHEQQKRKRGKREVSVSSVSSVSALSPSLSLSLSLSCLGVSALLVSRMPVSVGETTCFSAYLTYYVGAAQL